MTVIKLGYSCNNNCIHCVVAHIRGQGDLSAEECKQRISELKEHSASDLVITGGEPTIRKDFLEIVSYSKSTGFEKIHIQTNGRMFCDEEFARKTLEAGAAYFCIPMHGPNSGIHDKVTRVLGSFDQTIMGIKNLRKISPTANIDAFTAITKKNYTQLPETVSLAASLGVNAIHLASVQPRGNAMKYYSVVVPRISETAPYIIKSIELAEKIRLPIWLESMPFCLVKGYEKYINVQYSPLIGVAETWKFVPDYIEHRKSKGKAKFDGCNECKYDEVCEGLRKEYAEKEGFGELKPVK